MAAFTPLPRIQAETLVAAYGLGTLIEVVPIAAGSVNSNFRVVTEEAGARASWFVRLFEEQGPEGAQYDAELLEHLATRGVSTPRPLVRVDGAPLSFASGLPASIFPFVEGVHSCQRAVDEPRAAAVGRALAQLHLAAATFPRRRAGRFTLDDVAARLPRIARADERGLAAMAPRLDAALSCWRSRRADSLPSGVIHGDLFRDNVLFRSAQGELHAEVAALLDFESASDGPLAYDLAVTLLAWCFGDALETELARAMLEGYARVRPLMTEERAAMRAELALAALRFTVTRMTDYAMPRESEREAQGAPPNSGSALRRQETARVLKDWRRFWARFEAIEAIDVGALFDGRG